MYTGLNAPRSQLGGHRSKRYKMRLVDTPGFADDADRETVRRTLEEYFAFVSERDTVALR